MTKNELKTQAAIAWAQACVDKAKGKKDKKMGKLVMNAFYLWSDDLHNKDISIMIKWIAKLDKMLWQGKIPEAHINLNFALGILERQSNFLKGEKLKSIDEIIKHVNLVYEYLEKPGMPEFECCKLGHEAVKTWERIIDEI